MIYKIMSNDQEYHVDVLCVGAGTYDLIYSVDRDPQPDEKIRATSFAGCGGGPAANAAVTVSRLGLQAGFVGYLGSDIFGNAHFDELQEAGVNTSLIVRGSHPSALSVVLVKPGGSRSLVNYRRPESFLGANSIDLSLIDAKVVLFDGHEPYISPDLARAARKRGIVTLLDAGSVHPGTEELVSLVDYLVCSEKFGLEFTGQSDEYNTLEKLKSYAPNVIITIGDRGLVWKNKVGSVGQLDWKVCTMQARPQRSAAQRWVPGWVYLPKQRLSLFWQASANNRQANKGIPVDSSGIPGGYAKARRSLP
jgi:sulfofructose kinase